MTSPDLDALVADLAALSPEEQQEYLQHAELLIKFGLPEAVQQQVHDDPYLFAQIFFPEMLIDKQTGESYGKAVFHDELYALSRDTVQRTAPFDESRGFVAAAPRGHGKSSVISFVIVIWAICTEQKRFVIIFSDTDDQAEKLGAAIRQEFEENETLRFYYGEMCGLRAGLKWTIKDFVLVKRDALGLIRFRARVVTRGTGSSMRGVKDRSQRPDLVIGDDLENDELVESTEQRAKLRFWWQKVVLPMLDPRYGRVIVVGTILHFDSLLATLLASRFYVTRTWTCFTAAGESAWPERFPLAKLRSIRDETPIAFATEYLNNPNVAETRIFRAEDLQFYGGGDVRRERDGTITFRGRPLTVYTGVDPAISEKDDACEFAVVTIGVPSTRDQIIILRVILARIDFPRQISTVVQEAQFWGAARVGIEANAYQVSLPQMVKLQLKAAIDVEEVRHHGSDDGKRRRIVALAPIAAQRRLWLRKDTLAQPGDPAAHWDDLGRTAIHRDHVRIYEQLMKYPKADLNDGVDALATAVEIAGSLPLFTPGSWSDTQVSPLDIALPAGFGALAS